MQTMTIAPTHDLVSIGRLAAQTQRSVRAIEAAVAHLGFEPAARIDGIIYFDGEQEDAIRERLRVET